MQSVNLRFNDVSFSYESASSSKPVRQSNQNKQFSYTIDDEFSLVSLNLHFAKGWTGIVGPNGAGKSTVAKLAAGILSPVSGDITGVDFSHALYCDQQCEEIPEYFYEFFYSDESNAGNLRSVLAIEESWIERWQTLSFGERKRLQLAIALWREPALLILDEPVNHLDYAAKELITAALKRFRGTGLVVAHDRAFLDALCTNCLFIRPGNAVIRPGNYSEGIEQQMREDKFNEGRYLLMLEDARAAKRSANAMKQRESAKASQLSKKHIAKHDHDAKAKVDGARISGKDKRGARQVTLLERKAENLNENAQQNYFRMRRIEGILFEGERLARERVLVVPEFRLILNSERSVSVPRLEIRPSERISLTGENGSGKSSLLREIVPQINLDPSRFIYLPQEITSDQWIPIHSKLRSLPGEQLGRLLSIVHRLGSEPERILAAEDPSPGEKRKAILGLGLLTSPHLIIMDEPTNHLDMPSIEKLEEALSLFKGALLVVSHDAHFLKRLSNVEWRISGGKIDVIV